MARTADAHRLLILASDAAEYAALVEAAGLDLDLAVASDVDTARALAPGCNLALGAPPLLAEVVESMPRLAWVQSTYAGVDALCRPGLRRDYALTGVREVFGGLMREYVFGWILALERDLFALRDDQRHGRWAPRPYRGLAGLTLGVCGLGSIGTAVARAGTAFGMRVVGYRRSAAPCDAVERVYSGDAFHAFLGELDYLVLVLPATAGTVGLVDAAALAALKPGAVLINVGRGATVVEEELVAGLRAGAPRAAVLDAFASEPLPAASPLWTLPNAHLTPHNAAVSFPRDIFTRFVANYRRFAAGEALEDVVDFARGY